MFIRTETVTSEYTRTSKLGKEHRYTRNKTIVVFRCDSCDELFTRDRGKMDPKRLSNNYFHVCSKCDAKRFAQRRGKERKKAWDLPASSLQGIGKL
jgi:hypothetical protein